MHARPLTSLPSPQILLLHRGLLWGRMGHDAEVLCVARSQVTPPQPMLTAYLLFGEMIDEFFPSPHACWTSMLDGFPRSFSLLNSHSINHTVPRFHTHNRSCISHVFDIQHLWFTVNKYWSLILWPALSLLPHCFRLLLSVSPCLLLYLSSLRKPQSRAVPSVLISPSRPVPILFLVCLLCSPPMFEPTGNLSSSLRPIHPHLGINFTYTACAP